MKSLYAKYDKALKAQRIKQLEAARPKALLRRKALAMVRKIQATYLVRNWNVHASDDGTYVTVTDELQSLKLLKKTMGISARAQRCYTSCDGNRWGMIVINIKA